MDDRHLRALLGERHPFTSPASLRRAEDYLAEEFTHLGLEVSTHSFKALGGTYRNVIATLPPLVAARPAPPLIIAAHYDTVKGRPAPTITPARWRSCWRSRGTFALSR